jgi:4-hydroxy-3-polyprenylbenzoate decarboxylase
MLYAEPLEVTEGKLTGIPFPAQDEMVIEGEILPPSVDSRLEGPFGEWTGYYAGGERTLPVVRVQAIYHRNDPILVGSPPLKPPLWGFVGFGVPVTQAPATWEQLEAAGVPEVQGVWQLEGGGDRYITVVSIRQMYAGHAKQAGLVAAGCHGSGFQTKIVIVVDDDIDPTNTNDVLWAVTTRCDPATQVDIIKGCWDSDVDPRLSPQNREKGDFTLSRMIIDACKPFHWKDTYPRVNQVSPDLKQKLLAKWKGKLNI